MALVFNDRVKETSVTTGTGTLTLDGAVQGFETFSSAIGNSNTTYYAIELPGTTEFEVGRGTVSAGQLARTEIISSSNSDSAVDFSAGTKIVFCTLPASKAVIKDASNNVTLPADLTVDTDSLYVDSSNNRVGIGTTSPNDKLQVDGNIRVNGTSFLNFNTNGYARFNSSTGSIDLQANSGADLAIRASGGNILFQNTGATERARFDSSGNLGIGTTSPTNKLHVKSDDTSTAPQLLIEQDGTGDPVLGFKITDAGTSFSMGLNNSDGDKFLIAANGTDIGNSPILALTTGGNVGIGTTSPSATADIRNANAVVQSRGLLYLSNNDTYGINKGSQISFGGTYDTSLNDSFFAAVAGRKENSTSGNFEGYLQFSTRQTSGNFERMRITSSGNVGIGTSSPSSLLHLSSSDPQITITDTDGTGSQVIKAVTDDLTVDVVGQINLDADNNGLVTISDGGTQIGSFFKTASTFSIKSDVQDKRLEIKGNDGGSEVTAVAFHMANAGQANFNDKIVLNANKVIEFGDSGETISGDGTSLTIASSHNTVIDSANQIILDAGNGLNIYFRDDDVLIGQVLKSGNNDFKLKGLQSGKLFVLEGLDSGGSLVTALSLDMSAAGAATFNDKVILGANKTIEFGDSGETISGNGTDLTIASSGFINLNASSDITLNAAGNDIRLYSSATEFLRLTHSSGDAIINSLVSDKDIKFQGNDGGSGITALTLDMSEAGRAEFNSSIAIGSSAISNHGTGDLTGVSKLVFGSNNANDPARIFKSSNVLKIQEGTSGFAIIDASSVNSFVIDANQNVSIPNGNLTLGANLDVSSGTIKLDGNYPTGTNNVALGDNALNSLTSGQDNTCIGHDTGTALQDGSDNTFIGESAGAAMTSGNTNTAVGGSALKAAATVANTVAIGQDAGLILTSGDRNTFVGRTAGSTANGGNNNICLGYNAEPSSASINNEITLGDAQIDRFRIPGLQSGASTGDVLTYDGTKIVLSTPSTGVSAGFAVAMAIAL